MAARKRKASRKAAAKRKPAAKTQVTRKATKKAAGRKATARKAAKKATPRKRAAKKAVTPRRRSPETLRVRSVSPSLTVADLQKSLAWYRDVAGFHVGELWRDGGEVRGAEILAGAARFYVNQDDWSKGRDRVKGQGMRLHLTTSQNIDEIASGIEQRGGKLDSQPADMFGARSFTLTDPDGFKLSISSGD